MQHHRLPDRPAGSPRFNPHRPPRVDANADYSAQMSLGRLVSIPIVRRGTMQPVVGAVQSGDFYAFQSPSSGAGRCNYWLAPVRDSERKFQSPSSGAGRCNPRNGSGQAPWPLRSIKYTRGTGPPPARSRRDARSCGAGRRASWPICCADEALFHDRCWFAHLPQNGSLNAGDSPLCRRALVLLVTAALACALVLVLAAAG